MHQPSAADKFACAPQPGRALTCSMIAVVIYDHCGGCLFTLSRRTTRLAHARRCHCAISHLHCITLCAVLLDFADVHQAHHYSTANWCGQPQQYNKKKRNSPHLNISMGIRDRTAHISFLFDDEFGYRCLRGFYDKIADKSCGASRVKWPNCPYGASERICRAAEVYMIIHVL